MANTPDKNIYYKIDNENEIACKLLKRIDKLFNFSYIFIFLFIASGVSLGVCHESIGCQFKIIFILLIIFGSSLFVIFATCTFIFVDYKKMIVQKKKIDAEKNDEETNNQVEDNEKIRNQEQISIKSKNNEEK